jgi:hypothetical protein
MFCYYVFTILKIHSKTMKTKTLHRHVHPIHWHGSMYVAIAAILLATTKTSGELMRCLEQQVPATAASSMMTSVFQREAENLHLPVILSSGIRQAPFSGK